MLPPPPRYSYSYVCNHRSENNGNHDNEAKNGRMQGISGVQAN